MSRSPRIELKGRIRRHLGHLALATAALAAIATSAPSVLEDHVQGPPILLDSAHSLEIVRFAVHLRASDDTELDEEDLEDRLSANLTVRHAGSAGDGGRLPHRIVRAQFRRLDLSSVEDKTITTADTNSTEGLFSHRAFGWCDERSCDGEFELVLELLDPTLGGPVIVDWSVGVSTDLAPSEGWLRIDFDR